MRMTGAVDRDATVGGGLHGEVQDPRILPTLTPHPGPTEHVREDSPVKTGVVRPPGEKQRPSAQECSQSGGPCEQGWRCGGLDTTLPTALRGYLGLRAGGGDAGLKGSERADGR